MNTLIDILARESNSHKFQDQVPLHKAHGLTLEQDIDCLKAGTKLNATHIAYLDTINTKHIIIKREPRIIVNLAPSFEIIDELKQKDINFMVNLCKESGLTNLVNYNAEPDVMILLAKPNDEAFRNTRYKTCFFNDQIEGISSKIGFFLSNYYSPHNPYVFVVENTVDIIHKYIMFHYFIRPFCLVFQHKHKYDFNNFVKTIQVYPEFSFINDTDKTKFLCLKRDHTLSDEQHLIGTESIVQVKPQEEIKESVQISVMPLVEHPMITFGKDSKLHIGVVYHNFSYEVNDTVEKYFKEHIAPSTECTFVFSTASSRLDELVECLKEMTEECDILLTLGGSGPSFDDIMVSACRSIFDKELPGFGQQMRHSSFYDAKVPTSLLSGQTAGIVWRKVNRWQKPRGCLILMCPKSLRSIGECLDSVMDAVPFCIELINGPRFGLTSGTQYRC